MLGSCLRTVFNLTAYCRTAAAILKVDPGTKPYWLTFPTISRDHSHNPEPCIGAPTALPCSSRGQFRGRVWRPERKGATAPRPRLQALFLRPQFRVMAFGQ